MFGGSEERRSAPAAWAGVNTRRPKLGFVIAWARRELDAALVFQLLTAVAERSRPLPTSGGALELALQGTSLIGVEQSCGIKVAVQA